MCGYVLLNNKNWFCLLGAYLPIMLGGKQARVTDDYE
jgi:hypothetical protein